MASGGTASRIGPPGSGGSPRWAVNDRAPALAQPPNGRCAFSRSANLRQAPGVNWRTGPVRSWVSRTSTRLPGLPTSMQLPWPPEYEDVRQVGSVVRSVLCSSKYSRKYSNSVGQHRRHMTNSGPTTCVSDRHRPPALLVHTEEVTGSIPVSPTDVKPVQTLR